MTKVLSRRKFIGSGAAARGVCGFKQRLCVAEERPSVDDASPVRLGLASYTFRNFTRAQTIGFMKQLNVFDAERQGRQRSSSDRSAGGSRCAGGLCLRGRQAARRRHHLFREG